MTSNPGPLSARRSLGRGTRLVLRTAFHATVWLAGVPLLFSLLITRTYRTDATPPPRGFEEVRVSSNAIRLRAWLARGDDRRPAVVAVHGLGSSLEDLAEVAPAYRRRGHTVLLLELRGHGASEGEHGTLGALEAEDVRAAMSHLRRVGLARSGLILTGSSIGGVCVLRAGVGAPDVRAVIAEAPYSSLREVIAQYAEKLYGRAALPFVPLSVAFAEWRGRFDADEVDAVAAARGLGAPLLVIMDGADDWVPESMVRRVWEAHGGTRRLWTASGAPHAYAVTHPGYWPEVLRFLDDVQA